MADLIGFTSIALVCLIVFFIALKFQDISKIIFVGLILRILFILLGHYVFALPDSTADAQTFEVTAWEIAKDGFFNLSSHYRGPHPRFISWLIAIPYSMFGRSILMAQSLSLLVGIACIIIGWKLANKIWDKHAAKKVAWAIALFPSLVLYSVLVMREVYICFFIIVALHGICDWFKTESLRSIILAMIGFVGGVFFHGSISVGAIVFLLIIGYITFKKTFISFYRFHIDYKALMIFFLIVLTFQLYISNKFQLSYLGNFKSSSNIDRIMSKADNATRGNASWPEWLVINSKDEIFYKAPLRSLYFTFAPFPWDVKEAKHLIGMFDSFLYMYLAYLILRNLKNILKDPILRTILLILLCYIFVFGFGVGNFGTGIRHRAKFTIMFILLAGPLLKRLVFGKKTIKI